MRKIFTVRGIIIGVFVLYVLKCFWDTYVQYSTQISVDAGAGFAVGLIFSFLLFLQVKSIKYLYAVVCEWIEERRDIKMCRARGAYYGDER